jgi:hypothetical protein
MAVAGEQPHDGPGARSADGLAITRAGANVRGLDRRIQSCSRLESLLNLWGFLPKKKIGRPYSLQPDDKTLKMLQGLGAIQATTLECAAVLNVNESTLMPFLAREPLAREALEEGQCKGKISLRRLQRRHAETSVPMAIHLGRHWIDQTDKLHAQLTGRNNGPVEIKTVSDGLPTDEEFRAMPAAGREAVIAAQEALLAIRQRAIEESGCDSD